MAAFQTIEHECDFAVIGGGLAGLCAAVEAARHGAKVALMQDRPVLGGNASSEVRMWVCGAHGSNNRETGIIEELELENFYRNPEKNYSIWDGILFGLARFGVKIDLMLNCSCLDAEMDGARLASVTGWQTTTQRYHRVRAKLFADCSGDSVLAPLTGAMYRVGREASSEFHEDIAPAAADRKTMGMSCMIQARERQTPCPYIAPEWAERFTKEDLPYRTPNMSRMGENFWYLELGGTRDSIADTEELRDELVPVAYGMWDYVKRDPGAANWALDWVGMLPGKRESRRYVGDVIMTQNDVRAEGRFPDVVAYGGWSMDDHHPEGLRAKEPPTIFHPAPSPYGIPYRSLYVKNVENLFCAGRNISVTHAAMSSTRVMATCATCGQAVGAAAAIAARDGLTPRGVYEQRLSELRQTLMTDDCYLPFARRTVPRITRDARIWGAEGCENLRNGLDRPIGDEDNGCHVPLGASVTLEFGKETRVTAVRVVFDSDLNRDTLPEPERSLNRNMFHNRPMNLPDSYVPKTLTRAFRVEARTGGEWRTVFSEDNNHQRLFLRGVDFCADAVRLTPMATWGAQDAHVFSFDADGEE